MMHKRALTLASVLGFLWLTLLLSACGTGTADPAATAAATAPAAAATVAPIASAAAEPEATRPPSEGDDGTTAEAIAATIANRTPVPTPTAGPVEEGIDELAEATGLAGKSFLGQTAEQWINLALSALLAALGYLVGVKLLFGLLKGAARRTSTKFDDAFLDTIGGELKDLVVILVTRYALLRLDFWSDGLRTAIDDVSFGLGIVVLVAISLKLIGFAGEWYQKSLEPDKDRKRLDPIIEVVERTGYVLVIIIGVSMVLSHLGINVSALSAAMIFAAVVISLGARDIISDAISGFVILLDQPFRVGDTIEIEELHKRGTVVEIGTRTTRIRTGDNRLVVVPNSQIGGSQVINYSFPDPDYRVSIEIGVAYGSDFDQVRSVIKDAVRGVEGVLPDKPVDVLFQQFGDSSRTMSVRCWINNVKHEGPIIDLVCEALESALGKAGIDLPFNTESLIVQVDPDTIKQLSPSLQKPKPADQAAAGSSASDSETE